MPRPSEEIDVQAAKEVYATLPDEQKQEIEALVARGHNRRFAMKSILAQESARGQQAIRDVEETTLGERVGAGALGAANAMAMGFADEARGLATAIPRLVPGGESPVAAYVRGRDVQRGEAKAAEQRNLRSTLGGEVLGQAPTVVGGLAAKVPQGIASAAKQGLGALVKQGAKIGAAGGAVGGFGYGEGAAGSIEQAAKGAALGGLFGAGGAALGGLPGALRPKAPAAPSPAIPATPPKAPTPGLGRELAGKVASVLEAKPGSPKAIAKGFVPGLGGVEQIAKAFAPDVPPPAPVGPTVPWQPAAGTSTADVGALAPKAAPGEVTRELLALKAKAAAPPPTPPPLPPEALAPDVPTAAPAGGPPPGISPERWQALVEHFGQAEKQTATTNVARRRTPTPTPEAPVGGAAVPAAPAPAPVDLPADVLTNVKRALAVGNEPAVVAKALGVPLDKVQAVARPPAPPPPSPRPPVAARPATNGLAIPVEEADVVAAMTPEAFDVGEGALRRLRYGQEARGVLEAVGERVHGERSPQYVADLKKELRQGFADPEAVGRKVDELLTRGVDERLVEQALAKRRSEEGTEIARLSRKGGTDVVDDMVAAAMAGGAKTMHDVQRRTGLKLSEIEQAWERHNAPRLPKEPRKPKGQPEGPGSQNVINPAAPIGPGRPVFAPVYEEIFGEPFHVSSGEAAREAAARLPFGPEDAQGRMIFDLRAQGWQPRQIAKKLGITLDVVRGILKQRSPRSALRPKS